MKASEKKAIQEMVARASEHDAYTRLVLCWGVLMRDMPTRRADELMGEVMKIYQQTPECPPGFYLYNLKAVLPGLNGLPANIAGILLLHAVECGAIEESKWDEITDAISRRIKDDKGVWADIQTLMDSYEDEATRHSSAKGRKRKAKTQVA